MRLLWGEDEQDGDKAKATEDENLLTVEEFENHVYFYASIDTDRTLDLMKRIRTIDDRLRNERGTRWIDYPTPIWLHIQSPGGSLFAGFSVADQLQKIESPIYSVVEGYCASAATLVSISCDRRYILPNAFMLIHQLSSGMWGKYEEFKDEMNLLDMAMGHLVNFYEARTSISRTEIEALLKRDSWFSAEQCLKKGLVDEIMNGGKI